MSMHVNRRYVIFSISELSTINFDEVYQTSSETIRSSIDGTKAFVKFETNTIDVTPRGLEDPSYLVEPVFEIQIPASITALTTKSQLYTHAEFKQILSTSDWVNPNPELQ